MNFKWSIKELDNIPRQDIKVFSCFSGGGGSSLGYKLNGYNVLGNIEIDKKQNKNYIANLNPKYNYNMDIRDVVKMAKNKELPNELYELDILDGSPPCFDGDTHVLTDKGYTKIKDICVGNNVITHTNTYKKVLSTMNKKATDYYELKIQGSELLKVTKEHPFYVRTMTRKYNKEFKKDTRFFSEPYWKSVEALTITKNSCNSILSQDYVGVAINQESRLPVWEGVTYLHPTQGKMVKLKKQDIDFTQKSFWYLVGRYLGDGWLRMNEYETKKKNRYEVYICTGKHEKDLFIKEMDKNQFKYNMYEERTTYRFVISSKELTIYLSQFGKGAEGKKLTSDIVDLPIDLQKEFLRGYLDADGHFDKNKNKQTVVSISKVLILGIQQCIYKSYKVPTTFMTRVPFKEQHYIEGRPVNQNISYSIAFNYKTTKQQHSFYEDGYIWTPYRKKELIYKELDVYNISVEKDESYTVNNLICHNCSTFSMSGLRGKMWGKEKKFREGQKEQTLDDLFFIFGDLLNELKPKIVIGENVKGIIQGSAKENYAEPIIEMYQKMGYRAKYFVINSKNTNVPQSRTRVFFIGVRNDICTQDEFNELDNLLVFDEKEIPFSEVSKVADINESELKEITKGTQQRYFWDNKIDTDRTFADTNKRIYNKSSNFGDVIIHNDIPFPTLRASGSYMYHHKPFHISKEELILIQSFPYDYNFIPNTNGNVHYILGMSVPPLMTKAISNVLVEYFIKKTIKVDIIDLDEF